MLDNITVELNNNLSTLSPFYVQQSDDPELSDCAPDILMSEIEVRIGVMFSVSNPVYTDTGILQILIPAKICRYYRYS
jgi:hypothetical protein